MTQPTTRKQALLLLDPVQMKEVKCLILPLVESFLPPFHPAWPRSLLLQLPSSLPLQFCHALANILVTWQQDFGAAVWMHHPGPPPSRLWCLHPQTLCPCWEWAQPRSSPLSKAACTHSQVSEGVRAQALPRLGEQGRRDPLQPRFPSSLQTSVFCPTPCTLLSSQQRLPRGTASEPPGRLDRCHRCHREAPHEAEGLACESAFWKNPSRWFRGAWLDPLRESHNSAMTRGLRPPGRTVCNVHIHVCSSIHSPVLNT